MLVGKLVMMLSRPLLRVDLPIADPCLLPIAGPC
jgi:hypothetical protein